MYVAISEFQPVRAAVTGRVSRVFQLSLLSLGLLSHAAAAQQAHVSETVPGKIFVGLDDTASESDALSLFSSVRGARVRAFAHIRVHVVSVPPGTETSAIASLQGETSCTLRRTCLYTAPARRSTAQRSAVRQPVESGQSAGPIGLESVPELYRLPGLVGQRPTRVYRGQRHRSDQSGPGRARDGRPGHTRARHPCRRDYRRRGQRLFGTAGLAYNVRLASYRACDSAGKCASDDIVNSIDAATALGAKVINLSLGSSDSSTAECEAIQRASAAGAVVVASAGNKECSASLSRPRAAEWSRSAPRTRMTRSPRSATEALARISWSRRPASIS